MSHRSKQSLQRYATTSPAYHWPSSAAWVSRCARPPQSTQTITSSGGLARPCRPRSSDMVISQPVPGGYVNRSMSPDDMTTDEIDEVILVVLV